MPATKIKIKDYETALHVDHIPHCCHTVVSNGTKRKITTQQSNKSVVSMVNNKENNEHIF
jgi:hypothetical protein